MRFLLLSVALILANLLAGQVRPDNTINGTLKVRPLKLISLYQAVQLGYEFKATSKIYVDTEIGYVFGTYKGLDAYKTDSRMSGVELVGEVRFYKNEHIFETPIQYFFDDFFDGNQFYGLNLKSRSTGFDDLFQGDDFKLNSRRFSVSGVYGVTNFISNKIIFETSLLLGYSFQGVNIKDSESEEQIISEIVRTKFINTDGRNFINFEIRFKFGLAH